MKSVCFSLDGNRLAIGTFGSSIFEVSVRDGKLTDNGNSSAGLVEGHNVGCEVWCVVVHPNTNSNEFATAGYDGTVRYYPRKR